jgi:thiol:disulfide interchange protein
MKKLQNILLILLIAMPVLLSPSCTGAKSDTVQNDFIQPINSLEQFNAIIEHSGNRLIAFDLYADWCMPCHVLENLC